MVDFDLMVKFLGHSPHIKELLKLAEDQGFSNIERLELVKIDKNHNSTYYMVVNNRGIKQTEFKAEVVRAYKNDLRKL